VVADGSFDGVLRAAGRGGIDGSGDLAAGRAFDGVAEGFLHQAGVVVEPNGVPVQEAAVSEFAGQRVGAVGDLLPFRCAGLDIAFSECDVRFERRAFLGWSATGCHWTANGSRQALVVRLQRIPAAARRLMATGRRRQVSAPRPVSVRSGRWLEAQQHHLGSFRRITSGCDGGVGGSPAWEPPTRRYKPARGPVSAAPPASTNHGCGPGCLR
jgi:hypothetical protein